MNLNGEQYQLGSRTAATLIEDLRVRMGEADHKVLAIRFAGIAEVSQIANMLEVHPEGVFPTLARKVATGLNFGFDEPELSLYMWPNRR